MLLAFLILFFVLGAFSFLEEGLDKRVVNISYVLMFTMLILLAGFRPSDIDKDYESYLRMYYSGDDDFSVEITFKWIAEFVRKALGHPVFLFLIYAFLSLVLKAFAIRQLSHQVFLPVLMLFSTSYVLHDFNQIRAGVAAGFFLLAIPNLREGRRLFFIVYTILAILFHYSALIILFLLFLSSKPMSRWQYILYGSIIPICYVLHFLGIDIFYAVPIPYFEEKIAIYEKMQNSQAGMDINVFNLLILTKIAIVYYLLYFSPLLEKKNRYFPILLKIEILSIVGFLLLTGIPVLSFRVNEFLGVVEIVLFPMVFYTLKPVWVANTVVILMSLALILNHILYNGVLQLL